MNIRIIYHINEIDTQQWESLLLKSKTRSFFQTRECYDLYAANPAFMQPFCFAVEDDGLLKGVNIGYIQRDGGRIKRYFSRRAIINGGPLLAGDITEEALALLLNETKKQLRGKAIYVESRNFEDYSSYKEVFARCGFEYVPHLNFHIDTNSEAVVNQNLHKSCKRDIRTSFRDGAEIVENPSIADIHIYYTILSDLYSRKVKTPLFPLSFFEHLYHQNYAKFLLVKFNGRIVGGTVCVCLSGHAVYEWFACSEVNARKISSPSTIATYAGACYAVRNGYCHYDMMGAGKPSKSYGVRDFKAQFGGQLVEHGRFRHIFNPALYNIGIIGVKIMKRVY